MNVKRDGNRVWIEGVKGFSSGEWGSSIHGSYATILQAVNERLSYDDLVCLGGFAFRIGVRESMCPSAAHPACGYKCLDGAIRALPWRIDFHESFPWSEPKPDRTAFETEVRRAVKDSIDRGVPVHYTAEEDGLIVGYGDGGARWWCVHPYHEDGKEPFWHDEANGFAGPDWPWGIAVWTEPKPQSERANEHELMARALAQAVDMWDTERCEDYYVGEAAYRQWIAWLHAVDGDEVDSPESGMQGNGWCFDVLVQSRRIASRWLIARATRFDGDAADKLREAAAHYAKIVEICTDGLPSTWDLAPPPSRSSEWTAEMREEQVRRLELSCEQDRAATDAIRGLAGRIT